MPVPPQRQRGMKPKYLQGRAGWETKISSTVEPELLQGEIDLAVTYHSCNRKQSLFTFKTLLKTFKQN